MARRKRKKPGGPSFYRIPFIGGPKDGEHVKFDTETALDILDELGKPGLHMVAMAFGEETYFLRACKQTEGLNLIWEGYSDALSD